MLSRPPKKPGGVEADEVDTTTTMSGVTALTCENRNGTITNRLEHWKVPNIVRMEKTRTETITIRLKDEKAAHIGAMKKGLEPCDVFMFMGDDVGPLYQQTRFMMEKEIRDIGDHM